jgi:hypothetical protein
LTGLFTTPWQFYSSMAALCDVILFHEINIEKLFSFPGIWGVHKSCMTSATLYSSSTHWYTCCEYKLMTFYIRNPYLPFWCNTWNISALHCIVIKCNKQIYSTASEKLILLVGQTHPHDWQVHRCCPPWPAVKPDIADVRGREDIRDYIK